MTENAKKEKVHYMNYVFCSNSTYTVSLVVYEQPLLVFKIDTMNAIF